MTARSQAAKLLVELYEGHEPEALQLIGLCVSVLEETEETVLDRIGLYVVPEPQSLRADLDPSLRRVESSG